MDSIDVVCLSEGFDLKTLHEASFAAHAPQLRLLNPGEVRDPAAIRFALAHDPAPDAFDRFPGLVLACTWGAGVDGLMLHPGLPAELSVKRMIDPGQARMMAAFAAYYVTGWHRRMFDYPALQAQRKWQPVNWTMPADFPVGILGFGRMGGAIARALATMGYPVTAWASRARPAPDAQVVCGAEGLDRVLRESAALVNVLPLTPDTEGLLNAGAFARMRDDAILIQIGRGEHLVEADLLAALDAGRPALAALDVTRTEPLPPDSPLWAHPRILVTPHAASTATDAGVARSVASGIAAVLAGDVPEGIVDRERGY